MKIRQYTINSIIFHIKRKPFISFLDLRDEVRVCVTLLRAHLKYLIINNKINVILLKKKKYYYIGQIHIQNSIQDPVVKSTVMYAV